MIDLKKSLDLNDISAEAFLQSIQGNIVKGHGRDFTAHLICQMTGTNDQVRNWIADFAANHVTTASLARRQTASWKAAGGAGDEFAMLLLAPDGYRYLGFADSQFPSPGGPFVSPNDPRYFANGLKGQAAAPRPFNDPPVAQWEAPYQQTVHAMILLADDDKPRLDARVTSTQATLAGVMNVLCVERGAALRKQFPRGNLVIEHFGFQDGVSQPIMVQQDAAAEIAARGATHWNPSAPLELALTAEPQGGHGSFMVFRKLEQNVKNFRATVQQVATQTGLSVAAAGGMAVGRLEDGTPVIPTGVLTAGADPNDFHYDQDPSGGACPYHAHIRKTNPRGDIPRIIGAPADFERARRIVRRGITYGARPDLTAGGGDAPEAGVGLLFMCFQSNLDQFAIQQEGSDSNDFVSAGVGVDATIGLNATPTPQTWPSTGTAKATMANMVKMLGGEYFFAPSMGFLADLRPHA